MDLTESKLGGFDFKEAEQHSKVSLPNRWIHLSVLTLKPPLLMFLHRKMTQRFYVVGTIKHLE